MCDLWPLAGAPAPRCTGPAARPRRRTSSSTGDCWGTLGFPTTRTAPSLCPQRHDIGSLSTGSTCCDPPNPPPPRFGSDDVNTSEVQDFWVSVKDETVEGDKLFGYCYWYWSDISCSEVANLMFRWGGHSMYQYYSFAIYPVVAPWIVIRIVTPDSCRYTLLVFNSKTSNKNKIKKSISVCGLLLWSSSVVPDQSPTNLEMFYSSPGSVQVGIGPSGLVHQNLGQSSFSLFFYVVFNLNLQVFKRPPSPAWASCLTFATTSRHCLPPPSPPLPPTVGCGAPVWFERDFL